MKISRLKQTIRKISDLVLVHTRTGFPIIAFELNDNSRVIPKLSVLVKYIVNVNRLHKLLGKQQDFDLVNSIVHCCKKDMSDLEIDNYFQKSKT